MCRIDRIYPYISDGYIATFGARFHTIRRPCHTTARAHEVHNHADCIAYLNACTQNTWATLSRSSPRPSGPFFDTRRVHTIRRPCHTTARAHEVHSHADCIAYLNACNQRPLPKYVRNAIAFASSTITKSKYKSTHALLYGKVQALSRYDYHGTAWRSSCLMILTSDRLDF